MDVHRLGSGPDRGRGLGGELGGRDRHGRVLGLTTPAVETSLDPLEPLSHPIMLACWTWGRDGQSTVVMGRPYEAPAFRPQQFSAHCRELVMACHQCALCVTRAPRAGRRPPLAGRPGIKNV